MQTNNKTLLVQNIEINVKTIDEQDYISLTDMAKAKNPADANGVIANWMRTHNTIEFLGIWEHLYNPNFKPLEFEGFKNESGANSFTLSPQKWIDKTSAIGIVSKSGRYGGTFAHKDIAFEFGSWVSPTFKLYIIKEYQRLKEIESNEYNLEWNVKRVLSKANYRIHTDAVKDYVVPKSPDIYKDKDWLVYAKEADIINVALFGCTANQWRELNPERAKQKENLRDMASINELMILSNLETISVQLIKQELSPVERFELLKQIADEQRETFDKIDALKSIKKLTNETYIDAQAKASLPQKNTNIIIKNKK